MLILSMIYDNNNKDIKAGMTELEGLRDYKVVSSVEQTLC